MGKGKIFSGLSIIFITLSLMSNLASAIDITISTNTTWEQGTYTYDSVIINNNATLVFNGNVTLSATNLIIDIGSSISSDGKGYPGGEGPGVGTPGGGGGYGGKGGNGEGGLGGSTYGSAIAPVDLGSGGTWAGVSGGGAIRLNVKDTLIVNGKITANGLTIHWGGASSGGSIYITTKTLEGSGSITANGGGIHPGAGSGGSGGGGRIAIYYENSIFTGGVEAKSGTALNRGEDGTVAFIDTLNNILYPGHSFGFQENDSPFNFNKVILNNSKVTTQGRINFNANDLVIDNNSNLVLNKDSIIAINNNLNLNATSTLTLSGKETLTVNGISVSNNSTITHLPQGRIYLNVANLTIDSTSSISTDGKGYPGGEGPGVGTPGGGGGYGGKGGNGEGGLGGSTYGSAIAPVDLGSGGTWAGVSGGGAIRLNVKDTLIVNGKITANGLTIHWGGASSGGSIYITTKTLEGSGLITANGGGIHPGAGSGGSGGGGRIAIYYENSTFSGVVEAKAGSAPNRGEDGTVVFEGTSLDTPLTFFNLIEKSSTTSIFPEAILSLKNTLNNATVTGDLNGALNFSNFEILKIETGSFAGKGFSKGEFTANLEGKSYNGTWKGVNYLVLSENKIYLKGEISGDISGIAEGFLTETTSESGIYDKYQATWKLNRVGTDTVSATIDLEGTLSYQSSYAFIPELYLYQANMEGSAYGYYTGPLSAMITHLRLISENEYQDNGFSIISHNSNLGSGEGWAYNKLDTPGRIELNGLFTEPILGKLSVFLEETRTPKTLSGTIERLDLGDEPAPLLSVKVWGPQNISPGQKIDYIVEYRNDGLKAATEAIVYNYLDLVVSYLSASPGAYYDPYSHQVSWNLGTLPAKSVGYLSIQVELPWGLPQGLTLENRAYILDIVLHSSEENGFGNGIRYNSDNKNQNKLYQKFASINDAKWIRLYDKTNPITSIFEVYLAEDDVRTPRNGVGESDSEIPGPLISGYRPEWIFYSGGATSGVNQAKHKRISGEVLYLISPQRVPQEDVQEIKSQFQKIVVYQGDDLLPGGLITNGMFWLSDLDGDGKLSKIEIIAWGKSLPPSDEMVEELIAMIERKEGKTLEYLEFFPNEPGNKVRVTWGDGTTTEFLMTYALQSEDNIEVITASGVKHEDWIPVLIKFIEKYRKFPTIEDLEYKFRKIIDAFLNSLSRLWHFITRARDPNEKLVSPEGDVRPGDRLDYTINYENEGEGIAYGVYITDTLDEDLDVSTLVTNNNVSYDSNTRTITWFIGEVWSHQKGSVTLSVNVKSDAPDKAEVINFATVYFPSVPEVTRTNGTVNRITTDVLDTTPPETTLSIFPVANQRGWNNTDVTITLTAEDGSGIKEIHYNLIGAETRENIIPGNTIQVFVSTEGITNLTYWAVDNAGNIESAKTLTVKVDKTLPIITTQVLPQPNSYGWNNTDVTVSFTASDNLSGVASVTEPITVTTEGVEQYLGGEAVDLADNKATTFVIVNIDKTPPVVSIIAIPNTLWPPNRKMMDVSIGGSATDALSGIASTTFEVEDEYNTVEPTISGFNTIIQLESWRNGDDLDGRIYTISVTTIDKADNQSSSSTTVICPHDKGKKRNKI